MIKKVLVVIKFIGFYSGKHRENKREVGRLEREGAGGQLNLFSDLHCSQWERVTLISIVNLGEVRTFLMNVINR